MKYNLKNRRVGLSLTIACVLLASNAVIAQPQFVNPIDGVYGEDFIIVNYVDWDLQDSLYDNHCMTKTYDGHQGTDFVLKSFRQMDEGVDVLAADSGVVIFTHDGEFDREKTSVISKGLGNYIGITHDGFLQTYYGHLKKNSILVEEGDTVYAGQVIGQVASSGNSTDPHLHFELWYDSLFNIDPFQGPCGNGSTYWLDPIPYDSSFEVWTSSTWDHIPALDTVREAPMLVDTFDLEDDVVSYWSLMYGLRDEDSILVQWLTPDDSVWADSAYELDKDWWYYYYFGYISITEDMPVGDWTIRFNRNGVEADNRSFRLNEVVVDTTTEDTSTIISTLRQTDVKVWVHDGLIQADLESKSDYVLYSQLGAVVQRGWTNSAHPISLSNLQVGVYIVTLELEDGTIATRKVVIHR